MLLLPYAIPIGDSPHLQAIFDALNDRGTAWRLRWVAGQNCILVEPHQDAVLVRLML